MLKILESLFWFLWFGCVIYNRWGNTDYWVALLFVVVAAIPFVVIAFHIWGW